MLRPTPQTARRRGVILLVVLAVLTLFTIVGLSYVLYADAKATASRIRREAESSTRNGDIREQAHISAVSAWNDFLGQLIYDEQDDDGGSRSVLRGHSLARLMYGWNDGGVSISGATAATVYQPNDRPWTGTGRLSGTTSGIDNKAWVNYGFFQGPNAPPSPFRDPGYPLGTRSRPEHQLSMRDRLTGDLNVSHTYPDRNNMFLAKYNPTTGYIEMASYRRPYNETVGAAARHQQLHYPADVMPAPFPQPAIGEVGHVKVLSGLSGSTDAVWIDFGGTIHEGPDGRKYKCLIAPVILDMDGRLNLNTAGSVLLNNKTSSNQGYGVWEANPSKLSVLANATTAAEWQQLFFGSGTTKGRYGLGATALPVGTPSPGGSVVRNTFPIDFNGKIDPGNPAGYSVAAAFPGTGTTASYATFPTFDPNSYGNFNPKETTTTGATTGTPNHPSLYNPLRPSGANSAFDENDLMTLLRRDDAVGASKSSNLLDLLPSNTKGNSAVQAELDAARRLRGMVTTHSFDLDRPGSAPAIFDRNDNPYTLVAGSPGPSSTTPPTFPAVTAANRAASAANGEFDATTWRSALPPLRLDLRRKLTDYPTPVNGQFADLSATGPAATAAAERGVYAQDIYARLVAVTGANPNADPAAVPASEFNALRWLAQLAVNIVDFLDNDDYNTPFQFSTAANGPHIVYGLELPRLVINEYYCQLDNDASMINACTKFQDVQYLYNVWAELYNPLTGSSSATADTTGDVSGEKNAARLTNGAWATYRLRLSQSANTTLNNLNNTTGAHDATVKSQVVDSTDWGAMKTVEPSSGAYNSTKGQNVGFYVLGPKPNYAGLTGADPGLAALPLTVTTGQLSLPVPVGDNLPVLPATDPKYGPPPQLLLEKLANPYLKPNDPADATFDGNFPVNPYITVDAVRQMSVHDARIASDTKDNLTPPLTLDKRTAGGKYHPYAASEWRDQNPATAPANQPKHTFFRHNAVEEPAASGNTVLSPTPADPADPTMTIPNTVQVPFDVLTHLDRPLTSLGDLMHVSGCKPHELTNDFLRGGRFQHRARWTDQTNRIARLLDHVYLPSWTAGIAAHGRRPGLVNINTMNDKNVFRALCDALTAAGGPNQFTEAEIDAVYDSIKASRDVANSDGNPFQSLATALTQDSSGTRQGGIESTWLRTSTTTLPANSVWDAAAGRLLEPNPATATQQQALKRFELLTKLSNHLTTRSNVFAVWVMVGFFEVLDESVSPVKLGAEISWPGIGTINHTMFALVDRSQLQVWPTRDSSDVPRCVLGKAVTGSGKQEEVSLFSPLATAPANGPSSLPNGVSVLNPNTNRTWRPQAGALITVDPDQDDEETVVLEQYPATPATDPLAGKLVARFKKPHGSVPGRANTIVISRGNPGPWMRFVPSDDTPRASPKPLEGPTTGVVLYSIVD